MADGADARNEISGRADGQVVQAASIQQIVFRGGPQGEPAPVPRQLPPAVRNFVGRDKQVSGLDELLTVSPSEGSDAVVIAVVSGPDGAGKTALAVWWAHRVQNRFSDGTLFANLRGHGPSEPLDPGTALNGFLHALGVSDDRLPTDLEARTGLYRSLLAGRRMLIVLDNASTASQVRPLLPSTPGCLVLVTSRSGLAELIIGEAANPISLDPLSATEAEDLVRGIIGNERVQAEPKAVLNLIQVCSRLPLALRVAASRIAGNVGVAEVAEEVARDQEPPKTAIRPLIERAANSSAPPSEPRAVFPWRPRIKPEHRPYRVAEEIVRIGGNIFGIASDIRDPDGAVWALLELLDGSFTVDQIAAAIARRFASWDENEVRADIQQLVNHGYVEDADDPHPHGLTQRERERYSRSRALFRWMDRTTRLSTWDAQLRLRQARVLIVGMGGVGSTAALTLASSGIGHLHCIDADTVEMSNLNRQILYTENDLGRPKVTVALERLRQHNSDIIITGDTTPVDSPDTLRAMRAGFDVLLLSADQPADIRTWANQGCHMTSTAWAYGAYHGPQVTLGLFRPNAGPCYDCLRVAHSENETQRHEPSWGLADHSARPHPANAVSAGLTGNLVAHSVMSLITGTPALPTNCIYGYNLVTLNHSFAIKLEIPHPDCPTCGGLSH
ncbi:ThiF family adenylyltransferase [Amycolatopsis sp. NPDC058986]|uniref:ThiF family adenylyltransferase n=1 Tax=unclassified Amycolatopsis TaxID=2618356 RepID=UPI00366D2DD9